MLLGYAIACCHNDVDAAGVATSSCGGVWLSSFSLLSSAYVRYAYVIFSDNVRSTYCTRTSLFCRTLTSLCDKNKQCVSYLHQPKLTKASTERVTDSHKHIKR